MADPRRTIDLLWRREPDRTVVRRGRPPGLTVDRVVGAGIELADAEGLPALTMRRMAQVLDVVPMTLYTYVPDKSTLLELMLDSVYLRMPRTDRSGRPWRDRLAGIAADNRALFEQHPWLAELPAGRPPLGPGLLGKYEHELRALDGTGLDDVEIDAALTFLLGFVQASARASAQVGSGHAGSAQVGSAQVGLEGEQGGQTDLAWWADRGPFVIEAVDPHAYPTAVRVGAAAGAAEGGAVQPDHTYAFGLQRVLDGLGVLIDQRARPRGEVAHGSDLRRSPADPPAT